MSGHGTAPSGCPAGVIGLHRPGVPPPLRILVVDDNDALRENLVECLAAEGHHVIEARSGQGALEQLAREPLPDVVVVDQMMPGMTGSELVSRIRSDPRLFGVRLVLATGLAPPRDAVPVDAVLTKPFGVAALLEAVQPLAAPASPAEP
jgi:CheY-like chemotaxis protein